MAWDGILADDMGLGKTVQLLCVVCKYLEDETEKNKKPTLVVCPSSLCLNWQNEIEKFTQGVTSEVIHGSLQDRMRKIAEINNYNIVITLKISNIILPNLRFLGVDIIHF